MQLALVTGASSGIGADIARALSLRGFELVLTARSQEKLDGLANEIAESGRPRPLVISLDLSEPDAASRLISLIRAAGAVPTILVNNAGYGLLGHVEDLDRNEQLGIVDLNIRALVDLTIGLLPDLVERRGRILNVASIAAFFPGPGMAVYYASKAFVLSFSDALAQELKDVGVSVTCLCPGATATGFQRRAGFRGKFTKVPTMTARQVAEAAVAGLIEGRRRVVPGILNQLSVGLAQHVPRAVLLPLISRIQRGRNRP